MKKLFTAIQKNDIATVKALLDKSPELISCTLNVFMPLMGVTMLCQAYMQWNTSRKVDYFSIGTAAFIFVCSIVVFFVK